MRTAKRIKTIRMPRVTHNSGFVFTLYATNKQSKWSKDLPLLSALDKRFLKQEFQKISHHDDRRNDAALRNTLSRENIPGSYLLAALKDVGFVGIGRLRQKLVAIIMGYGTEYVHPDEGRPICKPHELYVDVVCAYPDPPRMAEASMRAFQRVVTTKLNMRALRLYATSGSRRYWTERFGYQQAETFVTKDGTCEYGDYGPQHYAYELKQGLNPTWRMTLVLQHKPPVHYRAPLEARDPLMAVTVEVN